MTDTAPNRKTGTPYSPPFIELDLQKYAPYLDDPALSDDDKRALLETLWSIITGFVQLGFGIHPTQQALEERAAQMSCAQNAISECAEPHPCDFVVQSSPSTITKAHHAACLPAQHKEGVEA